MPRPNPLLCRCLCSTPQNAGSTYWYLPSLTVTTTKARAPIAEDPTERVVYISEHSTVDLLNKNVAAPTQGVTTFPALQLDKCLGLTRALQLIDDIGKKKRLSSRNLRIRKIVRCRPVTVGYASILSWPPYDHWYRINHALRSREAIANTLATKIKTWAGLLKPRTQNLIASICLTFVKSWGPGKTAGHLGNCEVEY